MTLPIQEVTAAARRYCEALHWSDESVFADLCHDNFLMTHVATDGQPRFLDKAAFVARVAAREAFPGSPAYHIETVDVAGHGIAHVKLWVEVPPRRFEDYLGFFHVGGQWKLVTKLFRTMSGPALEG